ncbi:group III truncated hemoglobin [Taibaiella soli]|uniref:Globin n=1 Tax=Taibaiella soli TaxID=1649169 RepID=A0A2W2AWM3_9BACT|nr:group III truncated hemoglobin [Taibaiella soli]PZF72374.1 hypothetical protein DN068_13550 [Taibaiella soli]
MADISTQDDVVLLVDSFYDRVRNDNTIGPIFNNIIEDWSHHLPKMYRFWGTVLFGEPGYSGNTIATHIAIDKKFPLKEEHYASWIGLWKSTVDSLFAGEKAEEAKKRGMLMIQLINFKVDDSHNKNFIQ